MFSIIKKKIKGNVEQINEDGFIMGRKNAIFEVNNSKVKNIMICNKYLANPVVYVKVNSLWAGRNYAAQVAIVKGMTGRNHTAQLAIVKQMSRQ